MLKGKRVMIYIWSRAGVAGRQRDSCNPSDVALLHTAILFVPFHQLGHSVPSTPAVGLATGTWVVCAPLCPAGWAGMGWDGSDLCGAAARPSHASIYTKTMEGGKCPLKPEWASVDHNQASALG